MKRFNIIAVISGIVIIMLSIMIGMDRYTFDVFLPHLDLVSFALCPMIAFIILLSYNSPYEIWQAFKAAGKNSKSGKKELEEALALFETLHKLFIGTGLLGTLVGAIALFMYLGIDPKMFGRGISAGIIPLFYCVICIVFITLPRIGALKKKLTRLE